MKSVIMLSMALGLSGHAAVAMPRVSMNATRSLAMTVGAADCRGPIASEQHPIMGEKLTEKMRRAGKLPDKFVCGRCEYNLAGDAGAAYYVKACR